MCCAVHLRHSRASGVSTHFDQGQLVSSRLVAFRTFVIPDTHVKTACSHLRRLITYSSLPDLRERMTPADAGAQQRLFEDFGVFQTRIVIKMYR